MQNHHRSHTAFRRHVIEEIMEGIEAPAEAPMPTTGNAAILMNTTLSTEIPWQPFDDLFGSGCRYVPLNQLPDEFDIGQLAPKETILNRSSHAFMSHYPISGRRGATGFRLLLKRFPADQAKPPSTATIETGSRDCGPAMLELT